MEKKVFIEVFFGTDIDTRNKIKINEENFEVRREFWT